MLANSVSRNLFTLGTFEQVVFKHTQHINWCVTTADGSTPLHLIFATAGWERCRRFGKPVQTLARELARDTPASKQLMLGIDLLAQNQAGESVISLIAHHCLQPRSMRKSDNGSYWTNYDYVPERFPTCWAAAETLYTRWIRERVPFLRLDTAYTAMLGARLWFFPS